MSRTWFDPHMGEGIPLDRDPGDAELFDRPGIGLKMGGRACHGEPRGPRGNSERHQQLVGKVLLDRCAET